MTDGDGGATKIYNTNNNAMKMECTNETSLNSNEEVRSSP